MTATHKKLGFKKEEKEQVVEKLNALLCNYQVYYQKLRNFHWNVKGSDFYDLHEQFEKEYNHAKAHIDAVAERIRTIGATPISTLQQYLNHSTIEEPKGELSSGEMVTRITNDIQILVSHHVEAIEQANLVGDLGTSDMLTKELKRIEKQHWMLTSFNSN